MLIGELARRTGTTERRLRHYERTGLLSPSRRDNGYREYTQDAEQAVTRIRALLAAGLPTRLIRQVLPCALGDGSVRPCPGVLDLLREHLSRLDRQADELALARRTLQATIDGSAACAALSADGRQPDRQDREHRGDAERERVPGVADDQAEHRRGQ